MELLDPAISRGSARRGRALHGLRWWLHVALVALVLVPTQSSAPQAQELKRPPRSTRRSDLERVRSEIRALKTRLSELRSRTRSAEEDLQSADLELEIRTRELEIAIQVEAALDEELRNVAANIVTLTQKIERERAWLSSRLVALYRLGGLSYVRVLLEMDQKKNPLEAISMLRFLIHRDARAISQFQGSKLALGNQQRQLSEKRALMTEIKQVIVERQQQVVRLRAEKEALVAQLRSESSLSAIKLADLEEKERRLGRLFDLLYERNEAGAITSGDIRSFTGALAWPVEGTVVEEFGKKRSARFSTFTVSHGVTIQAPPGSEVRPVFEGTVLYSQWFKGYGNLVIVDHGNRIFSLYGNTKGSTLAVGEKVSATRAIALVAEDEGGTTGSLYFEVREDNLPVDPRKWLR